MMGVSHSMEEGQVLRISSALKDSANAIQGINNKFDEIDKRVTQMSAFNSLMNSRVEGTLQSFQRLEDTFNDRAEDALEALISTSESLEALMENAVVHLQQVNLRKELDQLPKAVLPLVIPLIILLIELAVANAYMGILLASLPTVKKKYSEYLLINASYMLLGLTLSLLWLFLYRAWLSMRCNKSSSNGLDNLDRLKQMRQRRLQRMSILSFPWEDEESVRSESEARMTPEQSEAVPGDVVKLRSAQSVVSTASFQRQMSPSDMHLSTCCTSDFSKKQKEELERRRASRLERRFSRSPSLSPPSPEACERSMGKRLRSESDPKDLHARAALASANLLAAVEDASALAGTDVTSGLASPDSLAHAGIPRSPKNLERNEELLAAQADDLGTALEGRTSRQQESPGKKNVYELTWVNPLHMEVTWTGQRTHHAAAQPPSATGEGIRQEAGTGSPPQVDRLVRFRTRSMSI
eukprot:TRINITY_DN18657_c0_g1_i2.p1 TRINITY_DN18657_c0_g1~~TRINITY_DN18657_c0_g1_i2.p1  ORF type:complete len:468 (+),score=77.44 TRINITY_DN18657_c0_g1_i2:78-1481(+)